MLISYWSSDVCSSYLIDLEELVPERIVDLEEFPRAIDTEVVDQDVRLRLRRDQRLAAARGTDIGDHPGNIIATGGFAQPPQRGIDAALLSPGDDDPRTGLRKAGRDREADAPGPPGEDRKSTRLNSSHSCASRMPA